MVGQRPCPVSLKANKDVSFPHPHTHLGRDALTLCVLRLRRTILGAIFSREENGCG